MDVELAQRFDPPDALLAQGWSAGASVEGRVRGRHLRAADTRHRRGGPRRARSRRPHRSAHHDLARRRTRRPEPLPRAGRGALDARPADEPPGTLRGRRQHPRPEGDDRVPPAARDLLRAAGPAAHAGRPRARRQRRLPRHGAPEARRRATPSGAAARSDFTPAEVASASTTASCPATRSSSRSTARRPSSAGLVGNLDRARLPEDEARDPAALRGGRRRDDRRDPRADPPAALHAASSSPTRSRRRSRRPATTACLQAAATTSSSSTPRTGPTPTS